MNSISAVNLRNYQYVNVYEPNDYNTEEQFFQVPEKIVAAERDDMSERL